MPRPIRHRRTQAERSAATQARLLAATIDTLVDEGWSATSTTAICARAMISRGAMLHHYPTKAALVAAAIEQLFAERHEEFRRFLAPARARRARAGVAGAAGARGGRASGRRASGLEGAVGALWMIYTGKTFYAWAELLVASRTDPELRKQLRAVDDRFFAEAKETCRALLGLDRRSDSEVAALTRLLLSTLDGLALNHTLGGRDELARDVLLALPGLLAGL